MIFAVVGSRHFFGYERISKVLDEYTPFITGIVSGGALGVDTLAIRYAKKHGISWVEHLAEWTKYGKSAGYRRNKLIVRDADFMIAFPASDSKGTINSINLAREKGIAVEVIAV
jgi:predicted Rossmann fold nucleotide-binding protein DprA/Smf involved in DNA uptake